MPEQNYQPMAMDGESDSTVADEEVGRLMVARHRILTRGRRYAIFAFLLLSAACAYGAYLSGGRLEREQGALVFGFLSLMFLMEAARTRWRRGA